MPNPVAQAAPRNEAMGALVQQARQPQAVQQTAEPVDSSNVDSKIDAFANSFLEEIDRNDDPDQIDEYDDEEPVEQQAAQEETEETEEPGAETPTEEAQLVEVEFEGKKYNLPPELRVALLSQADYTRKTQEVAASRKSFEAMSHGVQQAAQLAQQLAPLNAQLFSMQGEAQRMRQMLTRELADSDPIQFNMIQGQLGLLQQDIQLFGGQLQQATNDFDAQMQQVRQQSMAEGLPALRKVIPDIDKPETRNAIAKYAIEKGLPAEALDFVRFSPVAVELIWKANKYEEMLAKQAKSQKSIQEKVKGLPAVKSTARPNGTQETKQARDQWRKGGGSIHDPNFDKILDARLNRRG
jgi:hypothetical protein